MAYIEILPKSSEAQARLEDSCASVMDLLYHAAKDVLKVPDHDIIIELSQCTTIAFNSLAVKASSVPDVVVKIATSDEHLQPKFQALCEQIISSWDAHFSHSLKIELWINLIDTWGSNVELNE